MLFKTFKKFGYDHTKLYAPVLLRSVVGGRGRV